MSKRKRLTMPQKKKLVRLRCLESVTQAETAREIGCSQSTVLDIADKFRRKASELNISLQELLAYDDDKLTDLLSTPGEYQYLPIDCQRVSDAMAGMPHPTVRAALQAVYYSEPLPEGQRHYSMTQAYEIWSRWDREHVDDGRRFTLLPCEPGEYGEIDFSGSVIRWRGLKGTHGTAHVFIFALRYSGFYYVECFENETAVSWLTGIRHALEYFGGVPRALIFDNARALVSKPDRYAATTSTGLKAICEHYRMEMIACTVASPREKHVVERSVGHFQRNAENRLPRNRGLVMVDSLFELNAKVQALALESQSQIPVSGSRMPRQRLFEEREKQHLGHLNPAPFQTGTWEIRKANCNYIVRVDKHRYMVDHTQAGRQVCVHITPDRVRFHDIENHRLVGDYERDFSVWDAAVNMKEEYMSEEDIRFRHAFEQFVDEYIRQNGTVYKGVIALKEAVCRQSPTSFGKIRLQHGVRHFIKKYGVQLVDSVAREFLSQGIVLNYRAVRERLEQRFEEMRSKSGDNQATGTDTQSAQDQEREDRKSAEKLPVNSRSKIKL